MNTCEKKELKCVLQKLSNKLEGKMVGGDGKGQDMMSFDITQIGRNYPKMNLISQSSSFIFDFTNFTDACMYKSIMFLAFGTPTTIILSNTNFIIKTNSVTHNYSINTITFSTDPNIIINLSINRIITLSISIPTKKSADTSLFVLYLFQELQKGNKLTLNIPLPNVKVVPKKG